MMFPTFLKKVNCRRQVFLFPCVSWREDFSVKNYFESDRIHFAISENLGENFENSWTRKFFALDKAPPRIWCGILSERNAHRSCDWLRTPCCRSVWKCYSLTYFNSLFTFYTNLRRRKSAGFKGVKVCAYFAVGSGWVTCLRITNTSCKTFLLQLLLFYSLYQMYIFLIPSFHPVQVAVCGILPSGQLF